MRKLLWVLISTFLLSLFASVRAGRRTGAFYVR